MRCGLGLRNIKTMQIVSQQQNTHKEKYMDNILTWFYERNNNYPGTFHRRPIQCEERDCYLYIYTRASLLETQLLSELSFKDQNSYISQKNKIINYLWHNEGGWLVEATDNDNDIILTIYITQQSYSTPKHCFCLRPDTDEIEHIALNFEKDGLSGARVMRLNITQDSHIILPVDKNAEDAFLGFQTRWLKYLPDGFETSALSLLWQPSVGLRVDRLERILDDKLVELNVLKKPKIPADKPDEPDKPKTAPELSFGRKLVIFLKNTRRTVFFPLVRPSFTALLTVVIALAVLKPYSIQISKKAKEAIPSSSQQPAAIQAQLPAAASQPTGDTIKLSVSNFHELARKSNVGGHLGIFWGEHFHEVNNDEIELSKNYCQSTPKTCWGLIKLPAMIALKQMMDKDKNMLQEIAKNKNNNTKPQLLEQQNNIRETLRKLENTGFFESQDDEHNTVDAYKTLTGQSKMLDDNTCFIYYILDQLEDPIKPGVKASFKTDLSLNFETCATNSSENIKHLYGTLEQTMKTAFNP
jgi:hypothetical protein